MKITPERERLIQEKFEINHFPRLLGIEIDSSRRAAPVERRGAQRVEATARR